MLFRAALQMRFKLLDVLDSRYNMEGVQASTMWDNSSVRFGFILGVQELCSEGFCQVHLWMLYIVRSWPVLCWEAQGWVFKS